MVQEGLIYILKNNKFSIFYENTHVFDTLHNSLFRLRKQHNKT